MLLALALLFPMQAFAQFEGTLYMTVTHKHGGGNMRVQFSRTGVRSEVQMKTPNGAGMELVFLHQFKNPNIGYRIDDAARTYTEIDLKAARELRQKSEGTGYTAKKIGTETVHGYSCIHSVVTDGNGRETEMWTSKEIGDLSSMTKMMGANAPTNEGMSAALKSVGGDGFPVKVVNKGRDPNDGDSVMELTKVEKKAPPASAFILPEGYKKIELKAHTDNDPHAGMSGAGMNLPPEARKRLEERLKSMTPEQREQALRAMEAQGVK